ncbi:hypothetical protein BC1002_4467 [Paraburkholderia atlantica]|uniref:Uncharacterized protein n=1 Tax=Paraburkholderia atlantica TaxID=2654982 RepID=D5WJ00_PARAM|nr:hypothetical protein BC1002_4467 [Paraburkholderia atlantica]
MRRPFEFCQHSLDAIRELLGAEFFAQASDDQWKRERRRLPGPREHDAARVHSFERNTNAPHVEFLQQYFGIGLAQQQIAAIVLTKDLIEKPAGCLQLPRAFLLSRMRLEYESRHPRNLAKTSQREFGRIEARKNVVVEFVR